MLNAGLIVIVLTASSNGVLGLLTETPKNAAILLYSKLQLNCASDSSPSDDFGWAKRRQDGTFELLGSCASGSSGDYDFITPDSNSCHLVVSNATTAQVGLFRCVTFSESAVYAFVSIIAEEPEIAIVGGLNNVTVGQNVSLSCNVSYLSDIVPLVNWIVPLEVWIWDDVTNVDTQGLVMKSAILTANVRGQYSISMNVSFDWTSITLAGLDQSLAVYVSTQPLELDFMPSVQINLTGSNSLETWEIVLIGIGCVFFLLGSSFIICWCYRYHKHERIFPCRDCCECCDCWNNCAHYLCCDCCPCCKGSSVS